SRDSQRLNFFFYPGQFQFLLPEDLVNVLHHGHLKNLCIERMFALYAGLTRLSRRKKRARQRVTLMAMTLGCRGHPYSRRRGSYEERDNSRKMIMSASATSAAIKYL